MRPYLIILAFMFSCTAPRNVPMQFENTLIKTKIYAGRIIKVMPGQKYTTIITQNRIIEVQGQPQAEIGTHCFIRIQPCYLDVHPGIRKELERSYLILPENTKEFRIKTW